MPPKGAGPKLVGFLRLENRHDNHSKFYEMTMLTHPNRPHNSSCDVNIRYGRIGTEGKTMPLKGKPLGLPGCGADRIDPDLGREAFLKQLRKKFKDKAYSLDDIKVNDDWLETEIYALQDEFEDGVFDRIAEMLEDRGF